MTNKFLLITICLLLQTPLLAADTDSIKSRWLSSSLYGNDNDVASLRKVKIYRKDGGYRIYVHNQFRFDCELTFDAAGNPGSMANCVSQEKASPVCNPNMPDSHCAVSSNCFRTPNETKPECFYKWKAVESRIPLACFKTKIEHICKGKYTLATTQGYSSASEFTIARRLK